MYPEIETEMEINRVIYSKMMLFLKITAILRTTKTQQLKTWMIFNLNTSRSPELVTSKTKYQENNRKFTSFHSKFYTLLWNIAVL